MEPLKPGDPVQSSGLQGKVITADVGYDGNGHLHEHVYVQWPIPLAAREDAWDRRGR